MALFRPIASCGAARATWSELELDRDVAGDAVQTILQDVAGAGHAIPGSQIQARVTIDRRAERALRLEDEEVIPRQILAGYAAWNWLRDAAEARVTRSRQRRRHEAYAERCPAGTDQTPTAELKTA